MITGKEILKNVLKLETERDYKKLWDIIDTTTMFEVYQEELDDNKGSITTEFIGDMLMIETSDMNDCINRIKMKLHVCKEKGEDYYKSFKVEDRTYSDEDENGFITFVKHEYTFNKRFMIALYYELYNNGIAKDEVRFYLDDFENKQINKENDLKLETFLNLFDMK